MSCHMGPLIARSAGHCKKIEWLLDHVHQLPQYRECKGGRPLATRELRINAIIAEFNMGCYGVAC